MNSSSFEKSNIGKVETGNHILIQWKHFYLFSMISLIKKVFEGVK